MKRIVIQLILIIGAIILALLIWKSIQKPINFETEKKIRYDKVIERLNDIRKAQIAFKDVHGKFCGNWDSLITFVKYDSIPAVRKIGMLTDSMIETGLDEKAAMIKGLIVRDTVKVKILDEIFTSNYPVEELGVIPNSNGEKFWLQQTTVTSSSGVKVPVFEVRAHNNQILYELLDDYKKEIVTLNEQNRVNNLYPGLKVGSVEEANNNAGNWE
jgi:hypothetical protein